MFFAMIVMLFIFMRLTHGRRRHCVQLRYQPSRYRPLPVSRPEPNAFERLKQRYVAGEINDEQFEHEVDVLLRSPETRKVIP